MARKAKTHEQYVQEVLEIHPDYKVLSFYINAKTKVKHQCEKGHIWWAIPGTVLGGSGCPICGHKSSNKKRTSSLDKMLIKLKEARGDFITYVSGFVNMTTECWFKCKNGHIFKTKPCILTKKNLGCGCPICRRLNQIVPLEEVKERVRIISNGTIEYVEGYIDVSTKCKWKCNVCGHVWDAIPNNIIRGSKCPICSKYSMEKPVLEYLNKKVIKPIHDKGLTGCLYNGYTLRFDFIIKVKNKILIIETDGLHHFIARHGEEAFIAQKERDTFKNKFCKDNNIILIRVTSSHTRKWGTPKHITLKELFDLINIGISDNGEVNLEVFRPYDFNREEA